MDKTIFLDSGPSHGDRLPYEAIMRQHVNLRDACEAALHVARDFPTEIWPFVALQTSILNFNAFKSIGILLDELYYETAAPILRQMWEATLNLHWIALDSEARSRDFCNYTIVEYRKTLVAQQRYRNVQSIESPAGEDNLIADLDDASRRILKKFRLSDRHGRERISTSFSTKAIEQRSRDLGTPWNDEYLVVYSLTSMYAHGGPGAILGEYFLSQLVDRKSRDRDRASFVAIQSMKLLVRTMRVLCSVGLIEDVGKVEKAAGRRFE